ncbi:AAA family ATPase [Desulfovibrionales bacterium]
MVKYVSLSAECLRVALDPSAVPFADSREIGATVCLASSQPRALKALELGLHIADRGYNIYVAGDANLGRTYLVRDYLTPFVATASTPPDAVYVHNFQDQDRPCVLCLPAGEGRRLRTGLLKVMNRVRKEIPLALDTEASLKKRQDLLKGFEAIREELVKSMETEAADNGFSMSVNDQGGFTLYPLVEGKLLSDEEFERLDSDLKQHLKAKSDRIMSDMTKLMRQINREEQGFCEQERRLEREIVEEVLVRFLDPIVRRFGRHVKSSGLEKYFHDLRKNILDELDQFIQREPAPAGSPAGPAEAHGPPPAENFFRRFEVNLFVDNSQTKGAPIIVEDHPMAANLLGCIEREAELGALITDFTLIKAGSLHRANGGFLILHMEDLMQNLQAWEGLLRALRSGRARLEDQGDGQEQTRTKTIEPKPLKIELKVVLIGDDVTYETLLLHDHCFSKLFKLKAHLQEAAVRTPEAIANYLVQLGRVIEEAELLPFDRAALAGLVDHASLLAEDQKKLSLKLPLMRELMVEASTLAKKAGQDLVDVSILAAAAAGRIYRANLYEEEFLEEYDRKLIRVATGGSSVGRVNGLSVTLVGDYEFGLPHQIACTVGVGRGGIVDLEREAQMAGPIHTKAMMILKSYLVNRFAQDKPIILTGSLCFEQSYAHVEGDSASGAELAALLSALSGVPLRLGLAFTGAVNQDGAIMAVGGVTAKVEGFFEVCRRRGLTGEQGVVLPADNCDHLMCKPAVCEAVSAGQFHVYSVRTIEEAMELLTSLPVGERGKGGKFPAGTLYALVDQRLAELAKSFQRFRQGGDADD